MSCCMWRCSQGPSQIPNPTWSSSMRQPQHVVAQGGGGGLSNGCLGGDIQHAPPHTSPSPLANAPAARAGSWQHSPLNCNQL
jgi:hypothetical protein